MYCKWVHLQKDDRTSGQTFTANLPTATIWGLAAYCLDLLLFWSFYVGGH